MNYLEAINKRISRRSYLPKPIESSKTTVLKAKIAECNEASGLNITFLADGSDAFNSIGKSYGLFSGVRSLFVLKGPKDDPDLREKVGYYGEKLILEATMLELGTCFVAGTFDSSKIAVPEGEALICVITVGAVPERQTTKEKLFYKVVHRKTKSIGELSECIGTPPEWLTRGLEAVQKAPSTKNTQKVLFLYKAGVLRASIPDTYKLDYVDLGISKLHFELAAGGHFELGNGGRYYDR